MIFGSRKVLKASDVFVPGGMPQHTYVKREARRLEAEIASVADKSTKLITVTGPTKSGKTVLVNGILPRKERKAIWIDGGSVTDEGDFWDVVCQELDATTSQENSSTVEANTKGQLTVGGTAKLPIVGQAKAEGAIEHDRKRSTQKKGGRSVSSKTAGLRSLREKQIPVVVDDFHYIERETQGRLVRALKPLVFEGLPVFLIAIPHRRYDAIRVEREMTGRLLAVKVEFWTPEELAHIPQEGFPLLNVEVTGGVVSSLSREANGSPHLMQDFCLQLCKDEGVDATEQKKREIREFRPDLFKRVAKASGRVVYDRLAQGPRSRTDRKQRRLKSGGEADIYKVCLLALAKLEPGLEKISYDTLRGAIRNILESDIPQAHEVSRVMENMAEISRSEETSPPVLDWETEERELHITDPYFAFYLKWGVEEIEQELVKFRKRK